MKKKISILVLCHALFTLVQVFLISKISFIGKIGIALMYKEYKFLRSFPKTYFLLFGVQLLVVGILTYTHRKQPRKNHLIACAVIFALAVLGLWYTYNDFVHNYSHRLLKERFHLGFYLFWLGMMASCIFFAILPGQKAVALVEAPYNETVPSPPSATFPRSDKPDIK
ncbi:MAG: cytochrome d ubiquinol oxidase subunit II [Chitinophagaceae bacterium]|nr:MAG: cytochrome d ubiquinol oxidase subunit II [Chitinophagaceae bacterium]